TIHLWLSVPFGLIFTLMCLSGAILIFERDFGHIGQAEVSPMGREPLELDAILTSVKEQIPQNKKITGVTTYADNSHAYKVMLDKPAMAAVWVDQYTGKVIGEYERAKIFKVASSAHRRLFGKSKAEGAFGAKTGKLTIGITSLVAVFILLSGLVIWWPAKGTWRRKLSISTKHGSYRFWYDFHCVGGFLTSIILLLCVLTGLSWSFGWYRTAVYSTFGSTLPKPSLHKTPAENFSAWQIAYNGIKSVNPDSEIRMYQGEADVVENGAGNQQAYKTYQLDSYNGKIIAIIPYSEKEKSNHIKGWIYTLHVGSWAGWFSKILYLICVLIGALLPISGYYLWIKRLIRKNHD
ncbi:MAG: PepSY domain-containing protein, partial [Muribaculaceae bacterium]|nr:PepSY domain-containing protein [Muribaculaceae bacterium]